MYSDREYFTGSWTKQIGREERREDRKGKHLVLGVWFLASALVWFSLPPSVITRLHARTHLSAHHGLEKGLVLLQAGHVLAVEGAEDGGRGGTVRVDVEGHLINVETKEAEGAPAHEHLDEGGKGGGWEEKRNGG